SLSGPVFEGYMDLNPNDLLKGANIMEDLAGATRGAEAAAKKAADELKRMGEEASRIRLQVFPEEAFAQEIQNIAKLSEMFPEILDQEAVSRAFGEALEDFKANGISAS